MTETAPCARFSCPRTESASSKISKKAPLRRNRTCVKVQGYMASRSVNKVILVGHLGRDAETKFTPGGTAVTRFSVATSRRWKDKQSNEWKEETDWTNIVLWQAENLANYLTKGKQVYV